MTKNPWEQAATPREGDVTAEITYQSVGMAITSWERFEQQLAHLFSVCVTDEVGGEALPARRAYGSVISFQGRVALLEAAVDGFLTVRSYDAQDDALERWRGLASSFRVLINRAQKYSARRNEIAHGYVRSWLNLPLPEENGFALFPTSYNTKKNSLVGPGEPKYLKLGWSYPDYIYTSAELNDYAQRFVELENEAFNVVNQFIEVR